MDMDNNLPEAEKKISGFPWLVFKLEEIQYGVSSEDVTSITILPDKISEMPDMPSFMRGVFDLRGEMIPLLDLRKIFCLPSLQQEESNFQEMIQARLQDHLDWVRELERSIHAGEEFSLTTDPHQCAFGKWFDSYTTEMHSINHYLKKIDAPHKKLHKTATLIRNSSEEKKQELLRDIQENQLPQISALLNGAADAFRNSFREMVIVLEENGRQIGITVDEVVAVEQLSSLCDQKNMEQFHETRFITGISRAEGAEDTEQMILLLDKLALFELLGNQDFQADVFPS